MTKNEHILNHISEECAEVAQRCSKALRFGLLEVQPGQFLNNAQRLRGELLDLFACVQMAEDAGMFEEITLNMGHPDDAIIEQKLDKIKKYMERSVSCGTVHDTD